MLQLHFGKYIFFSTKLHYCGELELKFLSIGRSQVKDDDS